MASSHGGGGVDAGTAAATVARRGRSTVTRTNQRSGSLAAPVAAALCFLAASPSHARRSAAFEEGIASWYGGKFQGRLTANGEIFDTNLLTAAHKTLPFGTIVEVVHQENGSRIVVHVNGIKSAELPDDPGRREGKFALQVHGGQACEVWFKDIEITAE